MVALEILTKEDLQVFRLQLLRDIKGIITETQQVADDKPGGYKTSHVRKMLGCSVNKLVSLRRSKKVRVKKIGGTLYYNRDDIRRLMDDGY